MKRIATILGVLLQGGCNDNVLHHLSEGVARKLKRVTVVSFTFLLMLMSSPLWSATPVFDSVSNGNSASSASITWNHTVGAGCSSSILYVTFAFQVATVGSVSSATYNSQAMTFQDGVTATSDRRIETWYIKDASITKDSSLAVAATMSKVHNEVRGTARSYCNVDQTTTFGTVAKANDATTTITVNASSASGELVVDSGFCGSACVSLTVHGSQTQRSNVTGSAMFVGTSEEAGAASVTMSWTLGAASSWGTIAVALKPSQAPIVPMMRRRR